jgi:hypothetical protein
VGWIAAVDILQFQPITYNLLWGEAAEPAADAPSPVEIIDYGMTAKGGDINYAVVVRNPNQSRWAAWRMPVWIDVLDKDGDVIATDNEFIWLLPGQNGAVVGDISGANGAAAIEVKVAKGAKNWVEYQYVTGGLDFSNVSTKDTRSRPKTTGSVESRFGDSQEGVQVMAVYRDKGGEILGGDYTYLRIVPGSGKTSFEIEGSGLIPQRRIDRTEIYFESGRRARSSHGLDGDAITRERIRTIGVAGARSTQRRSASRVRSFVAGTRHLPHPAAAPHELTGRGPSWTT